MKKLNLKVIRLDGGTQARVRIDEEAVTDYSQAIAEGATLPPLVVMHDGADYWLADGFHRWHAHSKAGKASVECEVVNGTRRDAILWACGANTDHGLRRSNQDKRNAVLLLLTDDEWVLWSDREIARRCGVGNTLVSGNPAAFFPPARKPQTLSRIEGMRGSGYGWAEKAAPGCGDVGPGAGAVRCSWHDGGRVLRA